MNKLHSRLHKNNLTKFQNVHSPYLDPHFNHFAQPRIQIKLFRIDILETSRFHHCLHLAFKKWLHVAGAPKRCTPYQSCYSGTSEA